MTHRADATCGSPSLGMVGSRFGAIRDAKSTSASRADRLNKPSNDAIRTLRYGIVRPIAFAGEASCATFAPRQAPRGLSRHRGAARSKTSVLRLGLPLMAGRIFREGGKEVPILSPSALTTTRTSARANIAGVSRIMADSKVPLRKVQLRELPVKPGMTKECAPRHRARSQKVPRLSNVPPSIIRPTHPGSHSPRFFCTSLSQGGRGNV